MMLSGRAVKSFGGYPRGLVFASMLSFSAHAELDLSPLQDADWSRSNAAHLASRAGFGATQEELDSLALLSAQDAVEQFIVGKGQPLAVEFDASDIFDVGLDPFPPSRPATTTLARRQGHALGVSVKPAGNRPLQPVVNKFFYWLRASRLETDRVAYWWANRMLSTPHPLQEKIALFWHGHFATNEDKVRDYRKMLQQLALFHDLGLGRFRELMVAVATDPAMLVFLDAGVNVKDSPNENFAREIMELFTMGVGHYGEKDVQEAARAFTGWNYRGLDFHLVEQEHDRQMKTFLGRRGNFDGVEIIDLIMDQPSTAQYIGAKLYRYFVNQDLRAEDEAQLGRLLSDLEFDIAAFLGTLFLSNDFYDSGNRGSHIKSPVELMVSTYRFLGLSEVPGVPDFNVVSGALGQRLMHPPTVAGWSQGRSWITPSLMFERNNFILEVLYPDIGFVPPDRYPSYTAEIVNVQDRLRQGMSISAATRPTGISGGEQTMAASNLMADRDEDFNTRLGSMRGWQMALERVKPTPRRPAAINLSAWVLDAGCLTSRDAVNLLAKTFFLVPLQASDKQRLTAFLSKELGGNTLPEAATYLEDPLRKLLHVMLSLPEYQLG